MTVEVRPRAAHDAFGIAFQQMVQYLGDMSRVADRIADGDLTIRVQPRTDRDAFGRAFVSMVDRLSEAMHAVREGAEAITTASTEVAASSRDLSESTARDAERVERTVSTLDDVRASAARSAEDSVVMEQVTLRAAREAVEVGAAVREMAAEAVRLLFNLISNRAEPPLESWLEPTLSIRHSCGCDWSGLVIEDAVEMTATTPSDSPARVAADRIRTSAFSRSSSLGPERTLRPASST